MIKHTRSSHRWSARSRTRYLAFLTVASLTAAACSSSNDQNDGAPSTAEGTAAPDTSAADTQPDDTPPDDTPPDDTAASTDPATTDTEPAGASLVSVSTDRYDTTEQMLLANEINESGEPFAEALGYDLDLLDPAVAGEPDDRAYVLGIENYEYSRYQLGTLVRNSGIGLHMMWAPLIRRAAAAESDGFDGSFTPEPNGVNEDDELVKTIMNFAALSNETPPGNAWPQFAEFTSGDPHLPGAPDPATFSWEDVSTMRWDRSTFDKTLNPAAMGQTLMKQYRPSLDALGDLIVHEHDEP